MRSLASRRAQGGFTLVEIAIVLVIVGLLLAGVLKGQELIENSKIKNIAKDMDGITSAVLSYRGSLQGAAGRRDGEHHHGLRLGRQRRRRQW